MDFLLALAHPGHGTTDPESWRHYLTEPIHVVVLAMLAAAVFCTLRIANRMTTQPDDHGDGD